jgi:uncharacterized protein (DUF433 family)
MKDADLLSRIAVDTEVMVGKPVIKGTRLTVEHMVGLLAHGMTFEEVIDEFGIERDDLQACLLFTSKSP